MIIEQPVAVVKSVDASIPYEIRIKKNEYENKIDSIYYSGAFYQNLKKKCRKDVIEKLLPQINNKAAMNLNPAVFRWIIFHSIAVSLCLASSIFIFFLVYQLFKRYKPHYNFIVYLILLLVLSGVIVSLVLISKPHNKIMNGVELMTYFGIIFNHPKKIIWIIVLPIYLVSLIPIFGILLINTGTYFTFEKSTSELPNQKGKKNEEFLFLKERLNIFAFYLGLLVSLAVIGSGLQRDMIIDQIGDLLYPKDMIYAYGIAFSTILAFLFIPTSVYLKYASKLKPEKTTASKNSLWWKIGEDTIDNFKVVFSIILPLLSSIIQPIITGHL